VTRIPENPNERDTLGGEITDNGANEMGTVGWDDGTYLDLGTTSNDGNTLVAVQLYRGRDQTQPLKLGVAQGHKIWCQVSSQVGFTLPLRGTRVLVGIPAGMGATQGAPLIIGVYDTGLSMHGNLQGGETCVAGMAGQARAMCKANGTACLFTKQGNTAGGQSVTFQVNSDGSVKAVGPYGGMASTSSATVLAFGTTSGVQCDTNGAWMTGPAIGLSSGNVQLGPIPIHALSLGDVVATQLTALATWAAAVTVIIDSLIQASGVTAGQLTTYNTANGVFLAALAATNVSTTCKGSA
jgi:hypothetical protein